MSRRSRRVLITLNGLGGRTLKMGMDGSVRTWLSERRRKVHYHAGKTVLDSIVLFFVDRSLYHGVKSVGDTLGRILLEELSKGDVYYLVWFLFGHDDCCVCGKNMVCFCACLSADRK